MADPETPIAPVEFAGTVYKPLADGKYDAIICGTGLKECILSGLLSVKGKKVSGAGWRWRGGPAASDRRAGGQADDDRKWAGPPVAADCAGRLRRLRSAYP